MKYSAIVIIATRPYSERLPNKAFIDVAGISAIEHILNRLPKQKLRVVLAVPSHCNDYDYLISKYAKHLEIKIYHGHDESPLHRMWAAYQRHNSGETYVVRITHDDILIDRRTLLDLIACCQEQRAGYGISPAIAEGAGVEVIHKDNLKQAAETVKQPTEFVSYFVKYAPHAKIVKTNPRPSIRRDYRLTMDYYNDWLVLDTILKKVGPNANLDTICEFIDRNYYILSLNKLPELSVYTCVYNAERYIDQTIVSVLNQNHPNFEYVIVDDGSIDDTALHISKFVPNSKIRFLKNKTNIGLASSSNFALSRCLGKYVMRVDADDELIAGALNRMQRMLMDSKAGILYSSYNQIDEMGNIIVKDVAPSLHHHAGCAMMDKRLVNELRFADGLQHYDSLEFFMRIKEKFEIAYSLEPLWYYRMRPDSLTTKTEEREKVKKELRL